MMAVVVHPVAALSFRRDAKHRTSMCNCTSGNLEIPGSPFGRPGMTKGNLSPAGPVAGQVPGDVAVEQLLDHVEGVEELADSHDAAIAERIEIRDGELHHPLAVLLAEEHPDQGR